MDNLPQNWKAGFGPSADWQIACGGTEIPFIANGQWFLYVWNRKEMRHGYYNFRLDIVQDTYQLEPVNP
jgi:hypothetical protein